MIRIGDQNLRGEFGILIESFYWNGGLGLGLRIRLGLGIGIGNRDWGL